MSKKSKRSSVLNKTQYKLPVLESPVKQLIVESVPLKDHGNSHLYKTSQSGCYGGDSSPSSPYIIKKIKPSLNLQLQRRNSKEGGLTSPNTMNQALKQTSL